MRTTKNSVVIIALLPFFFTSCITDFNAISGKGSIVTETRSAVNFNSVEIQSAAKVEIVKGTAYNVTVSDYENIIPYLTVKVVNNRLIIKNEPEAVNLWNSQAKVTVNLPDSLYSAVLAGSGEIRIDPAFTALESLKLYGSGLISIYDNCQLNKLDAQITGSGNIRAKGTVNNLTTIITGSGNMQFSDLKATSAKCTLSGSGDIYVYVENKLDVYLSGSGDVIYYGNPTVNSYSTGSGNIYKR